MSTSYGPRPGLPSEYRDLVDAIKREVREGRVQAARVVDTELILLY